MDMYIFASNPMSGKVFDEKPYSYISIFEISRPMVWHGFGHMVKCSQSLSPSHRKEIKGTKDVVFLFETLVERA